MKKIIMLALSIAVLAFTASCVPTTVSKCHTDKKYEGDKVVSEYTECINQQAGDRRPVTIKNKYLFE